MIFYVPYSRRNVYLFDATKIIEDIFPDGCNTFINHYFFYTFFNALPWNLIFRFVATHSTVARNSHRLGVRVICHGAITACPCVLSTIFFKNRIDCYICSRHSKGVLFSCSDRCQLNRCIRWFSDCTGAFDINNTPIYAVSFKTN